MKFVLEIELDEQDYTVGFVVGYLEAMAEGLQDQYCIDQDLRQSRALAADGEMILCEGSVNPERTECGFRMHVSTEPFSRALRSLKQVEAHHGFAICETRDVKTYIEREDRNAASDPS